jgi:hypothetical protein
LDRFVINLDRSGRISTTSILLAIDETRGAGLTCGFALIR